MMPFNLQILKTSSLLAYPLVFLGGVITSIGPCNVAMIPLIIGYLGGSVDLSRRRSFTLSLTFAIGLAVTFMVLGVVASLVGGLIGGTSRVWYYVVAAVCVAIALQMLGAFQLPAIPGLGRLREQVKLRGLPGALALGLVSGLVASQCATPVLAAILTYVMAQQGALVYGAVLLFLYALGRGVPIVAAGTFTGVLTQLRAFGRWTSLMEKASAVIILGVGLYFLWIA
jgi:cytochrome c-type biogenesis protein